MEKHAERLPDYDDVYAELVRRGPDELYTLPDHIGAADFLRWVSDTKDVLLHGSNNQNITELEPRKANCKSKEFGNQLGVYAIHDPILPLFYAIKDKERFRGIAQSGYTDQDNQEREYHFRISPELMESHPWSEGAVYVLPKNSFAQGHDDDGQPINEWLSTEPVTPLAKIRVAPKDFPYLGDIQVLDDNTPASPLDLQGPTQTQNERA